MLLASLVIIKATLPSSREIYVKRKRIAHRQKSPSSSRDHDLTGSRLSVKLSFNFLRYTVQVTYT